MDLSIRIVWTHTLAWRARAVYRDDDERAIEKSLLCVSSEFSGAERKRKRTSPKVVGARRASFGFHLFNDSSGARTLVMYLHPLAPPNRTHGTPKVATPNFLRAEKAHTLTISVGGRACSTKRQRTNVLASGAPQKVVAKLVVW